MSYAPPPTRIKWDGLGPFHGVTIEREINGEWYAWRIPFNGLVSQALAAELLGVSLMTINNAVRAGGIKHIKIAGQPSAIPLGEVKRAKREREQRRRLRGS